MSRGNPYLCVGVRGELTLDARHDALDAASRDWLSTQSALGASELYGLVDGLGRLMGLSDSSATPAAGAWQLHEATGNWTDPGPLRLRGWMQLGLYGPGEGGDDYPQSPPAFAALRTVWDALHEVGHLALGGVDVEVPLWLVQPSLEQKLAASGAWAPRPTSAPAVELLVEVAAGAPGDEGLRAVLASTLAGFYAETPRAVEILPGTQTRRTIDDEVDILIGDPDEVEGVVPIVLEMPTWTVGTASWLAEVAVLACQRAGRSGHASISVRRWAGG